MNVSLIFSFFNISLLFHIISALERDLSCAVCRALVDEVNYAIGKVDPKKTIQVGSFRVDSRGNQGTYEKPYARSEVHLIEVFEGICEKFRDYAESVNSAGQPSVARTAARDGGTLSLSNIKISYETQKQIKHHCEHLVEEYEEEMISLFRRDTQDVEKHICCDITRQCSESDLLIPMPVTETTGTDGETLKRVDDSNEEMDQVKDDSSPPEAAEDESERGEL